MSDIVEEVINLNNVGKPLNERVYSKFAGQVRSMLLDLYFGGLIFHFV